MFGDGDGDRVRSRHGRLRRAAARGHHRAANVAQSNGQRRCIFVQLIIRHRDANHAASRAGRNGHAAAAVGHFIAGEGVIHRHLLGRHHPGVQVKRQRKLSLAALHRIRGRIGDAHAQRRGVGDGHRGRRGVAAAQGDGQRLVGLHDVVAADVDAELNAADAVAADVVAGNAVADGAAVDGKRERLITVVRGRAFPSAAGAVGGLEQADQLQLADGGECENRGLPLGHRVFDRRQPALKTVVGWNHGREMYRREHNFAAAGRAGDGGEIHDEVLGVFGATVVVDADADGARGRGGGAGRDAEHAAGVGVVAGVHIAADAVVHGQARRRHDVAVV